METTRKVFTATLSSVSTNAIIAIVAALVATYIAALVYGGSLTKPKATEGFGGVAVGSGVPDCLRTSSELASVVDFFVNKTSTTEEGADDLREFILICSKLSCFKKDLMGVAGVVEATRYQAYSTAHDMEPVAETTSRCFAKTIPPRDLNLIMDKWGSRGEKLIRRLCTSFDVSSSDYNELVKKFKEGLNDVNDVAKKTCFGTNAIIAGIQQVRMPSAYETPDLVDLGPYKGYY
jgi:hypothetical protein